MEKYEKPVLEELGRLHDVTGGILDSLIDDVLGGLLPGRPTRGSS